MNKEIEQIEFIQDKIDEIEEVLKSNKLDKKRKAELIWLLKQEILIWNIND